ncbi:MAG: hypothetical protein K2F84_07225 [Bacteroidales bacterium]|nr:hypothetical protein [Bacteroidales bacterium]
MPKSDTHRWIPSVRHGLWLWVGLFLLLECFAVSCRKEPTDFETGSNPLRFSADTVCFDTVLSTLNEPVKRFTIYNPGKKPVKIARIYIRRGESGYGSESFRFTVNGDTSTEIRDLVIGAKDSVFAFIRSGVHLSGQNQPFIVDAYFQCDIAESKSSQSVYLYAYGQDAHYWHPDRVYARPYPSTEQPGGVDTQYIRYFIWSPDSIITAEKPYAIFGYLTVPEGVTLNIPAGARLHFGTDAGIWVQQGGSLRIDGTLENPVRFGGLHLDTNYRNEPGQWGHIWLDAESGDHSIRYAIIQDGSSGIWLDSSTTATVHNLGLTIENTRITNMTNYGLVAYRNAIEGTNLVIGQCDKAVSLQRGGSYKFTHCTFHSSSYNGYSLEMLDGKQAGATLDFSNCRFINSIFYGSSSDQLYLGIQDEQNAPCAFDHCLIRQRNTASIGELDKFSACAINLDPKFHDIQYNRTDFRIADTTSGAFRKGSPAAVSGVAESDITGFARPLVPTLGAYEYQPLD